MTTDIVDLRAFYLSPLGHATRRLLRQKLLQLWPDLRGMNLLALGFATPVLRPWLGQTDGVFALMPAAQGVVYWPKEGPNRTALADPLDLPLPDNSIDRVLLLHAMESAEDSSALLREVWRVLKSGGRMIAVVPNRRGIWALRIFSVLFIVTLCAEFVANDRPLLTSYDGQLYIPVLVDYPETTFGGEFGTNANYRDAFVADKIIAKGWMIWPPIRYSYDTINYNLQEPAPSPPSWENLLGTDDQGRDVLARAIYGFRISVLFGLLLTIFSSIIGVTAGATQGFFGGRVDLVFQRFLEIWSSIPSLFVLIIISSVLVPGFWTLLGVLLLFHWVYLVGVVRAEFLRGRNFEYITAARALGLSNIKIMFKHLLPNAMVATLTFLPFKLSGSITALTALDFLGLGLPPGSPSLGELLAQGKANLQAPWLGLAAFASIAGLLSLLIFVGEGVRDALDPRKTFK